MILVLTFIACTAAQPERCRTVQLPWDGSLMTCMLLGQQAVSAWATEHHLTVPRGWRCGPVERAA